MKNKISQYSIWAPIIRNKVKEQEEKKGKKLTKEEEKKIIKKEKRKCRRRAGLLTVVAALGFTAGYNNIKLLPEGKNNNIKIEEQADNKKISKDDMRERIKIEETPTVEQEEESINVKDILAEYEYNIEEEEIGYIKSKPQFIIIDENKNYVADYKEKTNASGYITDKNRIDEMYAIVDKRNDTIITTLGKIDNKYVNINSKQIMVNNKEYFQGETVLDLSKDKDGNKKTQEQLKEVYNGLEDKYNQIIKNNQKGYER